MANATIHIKSTAFNAGQPLYGTPPAKARVTVSNFGMQGNDLHWALDTAYVDDEFYTKYPRGSLVVSTNDAVIDEVQIKRASQSIRNQLASLVRNGTIEVIVGGAPLTPAAIVVLTFP